MRFQNTLVLKKAHRFALVGILCACIGIATATGALLPPDFVLRQADAQLGSENEIVLLREVIGTGLDAPYLEQIMLKDGRVRVETPAGTWLYPAVSRSISEVDHRCGMIDALFFLKQTGLPDVMKKLGISTEVLVADRIERPEGPLPFDVVYRIGAIHRDDTPYIEVGKETWYIRALQFRERQNGPLWRAEYGGHGTIEELPSWIPSTVQVFRDGVLVESIKVLRRLKAPITEPLLYPTQPRTGNPGEH